jgi:hypothetical protein
MIMKQLYGIEVGICLSLGKTRVTGIDIEKSWYINHIPQLYPLLICYVAIENDHKNRGFSH